MNGLTTLPRNLAFAAAGALAAPLFVALARPVLGASCALSLYAVAISAAYVFALAPRPTLGLGAALALALPALGLRVFGGSPAEIAFLCAGLLGVLRSGWLRRDPRSGTRFARAFAIEVTLLGAGLWLGAWAGQGSFFPIAMGVWSFFLVQSAFVLVGGPPAARARTRSDRGVDPFDAAQRRARSLLEDDLLG
jgi:hypothetical protein